MQTTEVKICDLEGYSLDWAVDQAVGRKLSPEYWRLVPSLIPSYSSDWSQGGPLIERFGITVEYAMVGMGDWHAYQRNDEDNVGFYAHTPLEAAMRAIVAAELGDTVDVPEVLVKS